jgi:predicted permease
MSLRSWSAGEIARIKSWLGALLWRNRLEAEMDAELASHVEHRSADLVRAGKTPDEARRLARIEMGTALTHKENMRGALGLHRWDELRADLRYGLRMMAKNPGFTAVGVVTLALGIGINAAVFSVAEAALLRSWPAAQPERLARITATTPEGQDADFSYADYRDLAAQSRLLEGFVAWSRRAKTLQVGNETRSVLDDVVSPNYFAVLGIRPALGRGLEAESAGGRTVVMGDSLWRSAFNADPAIVGKQISLTNRSYTVIGVAPARFHGLQRGIPTDLWLSVSSEASAGELAERSDREYEVLGRMRPGVTAEQARAELGMIGRRLARTYPADDKARNLGMEAESERLRAALVPTLLLQASVGIVLLICCANIAGMALARAETRRGEMAVRLALGAGRGRLVRQLLTESALLAGLGAGLGLLVAWRLIGLQAALLPPAEFTLGLDLRLDGPVLLYTAAISALAVLLFGLAPALQAAKTSLTPALKKDESTGRKTGRWLTVRNLMVLGETALSVVLLTASGLLVRSLVNTQKIDLGFDKEKNLIFLDLTPGIADYNGQRSLDFLTQAEGRVASLPGVKRVSLARRVLLSDSGGGTYKIVTIPGVTLPDGRQSLSIKYNAVDAGYFQTMGTRLLRGRDFTVADNATGAKVAVISRAMASRFWPGQDALGRHIVVGGKDGDCMIVGVVQDARIVHVGEETEPYIYLPLAQSPTGEATLIVEAASPAATLIPAMRAQINDLDGRVPVGIRTMSYLMSQAFWSDRLAVGFMAALGALGTLLGAIGLYGVLAYLVNRRRKEIGIRMALGAGRGDVLRLIFRQGVRLALVGAGVGLAASFALMRLMAGFLYGVKPSDPVAFAGSVVVVLLVAVGASWLPARRAAAVQPMEALRHE